MTSTKKTFQSIQLGSQEVNVAQADFNYYCADGKRSMFYFFSVPLKNPEKKIWCNRMGKVVTKVWKPSVMFAQFIIIPNGINTKYRSAQRPNFQKKLYFVSEQLTGTL